MPKVERSLTRLKLMDHSIKDIEDFIEYISSKTI